jgi:hypothetical protein
VYEYVTYGAHLTSALRFPELGEPDEADSLHLAWRLDLADEAPPPFPDARTLGDADYAGDVRISLLQAGDQWRMVTSDAGTWDLFPHEGTMRWYPEGDAVAAKARYDALGRVMPIMLHSTGALCLHGSSVATRHGGIAILGSKGRGKSSLAVACMDAGAELAGDDVAVLRAGSAPMLHPGAPFARLRADSAGELGRESESSSVWGSEKMLLPATGIVRRMTRAAPLRSLYLLESGAGDQVGLQRQQVSGAAASVAILAQATSALLLGGDEQMRLLERVSRILEGVPVYVLRVPRNLAVLRDSARELLAWIEEDAGAMPAGRDAGERHDEAGAGAAGR